MREPGQVPTRANAKIRTSRRKLPGVASCGECDALNPGATRERVRQHVKKTGHTAFFLIEDTTMYGPAGGAR